MSLVSRSFPPLPRKIILLLSLFFLSYVYALVLTSFFNSHQCQHLVANNSLTETIVFVYMGMGVFTGGFQNWDLSLSIVAFVACLIGRAVNIFPLSFAANFCRDRSNRITGKMQVVLWFAGLRGAIAFALSENMVSTIRYIYIYIYLISM